LSDLPIFVNRSRLAHPKTGQSIVSWMAGLPVLSEASPVSVNTHSTSADVLHPNRQQIKQKRSIAQYRLREIQFFTGKFAIKNFDMNLKYWGGKTSWGGAPRRSEGPPDERVRAEKEESTGKLGRNWESIGQIDGKVRLSGG
jgi:hypothetical protein